MPIPLGILAVAGAGASAAGAYDLLETTVLSSQSAGVTFSNLNTYTDYKHLQIRFVTRSVFNNPDDDFFIQLNGDTASNYWWHMLRGDGSSVTSTNQQRPGLRIYSPIASGSSNTTTYTGGILDILDFASSNKNTTMRVLHGQAFSGNDQIILASAMWNNTAAVTSVTFDPNYNFAVGSRFSLYGVK